MKNKKQVIVIVMIGILLLTMKQFKKEEMIPNKILELPPVTTQTEHTNSTVFLMDERSIDKKEAMSTMQNPLAGRNVFFAGYADATLSKTSTVALENLPENEDFLLKYIITDTTKDTIVFETNLISSGQCVVWTPGESLEGGTYELQFLAIPYYRDENDNFQQLTSGCNEVCYQITE